MPIEVVRNDITKMHCDAIVNSTNIFLAGGGGVDGAIRKAAGKGLMMECLKLRGCRTGHAKITGAYRLPCRYIIHTVGPRWKGGKNGEEELLKSCYRECLRFAVEYRCKSVAFPLISSGVYGYPKYQALRVAIETMEEFLADYEMRLYIVVYDKTMYEISQHFYPHVQTYIDDSYVSQRQDPLYEWMRESGETQVLMPADIQDEWERRADAFMPEASREPFPDDAWMTTPGLTTPGPTVSGTTAPEPAARAPAAVEYGAQRPPSLEDALALIDESFSQMLMRKIIEKGLTDVQCYKKANVDRKLFSKIRSNIHYQPKKTTALAFAIALELNMKETEELLMKAGYALSKSSKFDIIIQYFIINGNYNIYEINEALFAFDQSLLGA